MVMFCPSMPASSATGMMVGRPVQYVGVPSHTSQAREGKETGIEHRSLDIKQKFLPQCT